MAVAWRSISGRPNSPSKCPRKLMPSGQGGVGGGGAWGLKSSLAAILPNSHGGVLYMPSPQRGCPGSKDTFFLHVPKWPCGPAGPEVWLVQGTESLPNHEELKALCRLPVASHRGRSSFSPVPSPRLSIQVKPVSILWALGEISLILCCPRRLQVSDCRKEAGVTEGGVERRRREG